jgi:hypothetical protein
MIANSPNQVSRCWLENSRKVRFTLDPDPGYPTNAAPPGKSTAVNSDTVPATSEAVIPPPGQYCVYAILCDDNSLYIGYTNDLNRRWRAQAGSAAVGLKHKPQRIAYSSLLSRGSHAHGAPVKPAPA